MKNWLSIALVLLFSCLLFGESVADSTRVSETPNFSTYLFAELGSGRQVDNGMVLFQFGFDIDFANDISAAAYILNYCERFELLKPTKYSFTGKGVQLGIIRHFGLWELNPTIGYEHGTMKTGEWEYNQGMIGGHYDETGREKTHFIPVSFIIRAKLSQTIAVRSRIFYSYNSKYPMSGISIGLGFGRV